jgi:eukaryotic-like serine/threonine-protein kinase
VSPDGTGYTSGSPSMVGKKINNYELRELVGDGAMGVVYLAEHPVLRRRVAVKLLKRQYLESPSLVARFINEARAAAAIHHPNVIEVIDVGTVDDDVPYIMMEFLEGEPLSRRLARERLRVGKAVDIAIQSARAVAASHALEIVHRDLKPENLFLVPDPMSPGGERVKVLDFGIAKLRPDWSGSDGAKTRTGVIFGTPAYMSPEQCRGLNDEVDGATDIYALGCILFEMLCGRAPYVSQGWGDVLMMHMSDDIPVPSAENPRVKPAIDQVVRTALAKKKGDRFPSMRDMHRALAQARNDVEDTPAPLHKTDPVLPAIVLGPDGRLPPPPPTTGRAPEGTPSPQDSLIAFEAVAPSPRRRIRSLVLAGIIAAGAAAGITLALRRPGATVEPRRIAAPAPTAQAPAAPAAPVAPPTIAQPDEAPPPAGQAAPLPAAKDEESQPPTTVAKGGNDEIKSVRDARPTKLKAAKSNRHAPKKRKDPVKW